MLTNYFTQSLHRVSCVKRAFQRHVKSSNTKGNKMRELTNTWASSLIQSQYALHGKLSPWIQICGVLTIQRGCLPKRNDDTHSLRLRYFIFWPDICKHAYPDGHRSSAPASVSGRPHFMVINKSKQFVKSLFYVKAVMEFEQCVFLFSDKA